VTAVVDPGPFPRAVCAACGRPASVCLCAHLVKIPSTTRVVLLQHPREREVAIGTAKIAAMCLERSELHVGVSFENDAAVQRAISDPAAPAALLWPGEGATDVIAHPPDHPVTLVVVDGTWSLAKKLVRMNPTLAKLPRWSFVPRQPSQYRIRREPRESYVSTIEALVYVLSAIEKDDRFEAMLAPFRAMIDHQLEHQARLGGTRKRMLRAREGAPPKPARVPTILRERTKDLVCVTVEANAWPYEDDRPSPDEMIQWLACRVATGEVFEGFAKPEGRLAPSTPLHTRIPEERIASAGSFADLAAQWRDFVRDDDVICGWGTYATSLMRRQGGHLPAGWLDLRAIAGAHVGGKPGSMDQFLARAGRDFGAPRGVGRGGDRLAHAVAVTETLIALARGELDPSLLRPPGKRRLRH
jgi:DTW domain-containing protein YfiP